MRLPCAFCLVPSYSVSSGVSEALMFATHTLSCSIVSSGVFLRPSSLPRAFCLIPSYSQFPLVFQRLSHSLYVTY